MKNKKSSSMVKSVMIRSWCHYVVWLLLCGFHFMVFQLLFSTEVFGRFSSMFYVWITTVPNTDAVVKTHLIILLLSLLFFRWVLKSTSKRLKLLRFGLMMGVYSKPSKNDDNKNLLHLSKLMALQLQTQES